MLVFMKKKGRSFTPSLSAKPSTPLVGPVEVDWRGTQRDRPGTEQGTSSVPATNLSAYMATLSVTERYRPAYLSKGKEWIIMYYARHPDTGAWRRCRQKLNWIKDPVERKRYAAQRIRELNAKLALGWNPITDRAAPRSATTVAQAMDHFLQTKLREGIRKDSERTYRSMLGMFSDWLKKNGKLDVAVGTIGEDEAITFMDWCFVAKHISPRTFNNYRAFYGTLCLWWKRHKYIRDNPFEMVDRKKYDKRRKSRRMLTDAERHLVRAYMSQKQPRFFAFSLIMFHCALRPKEVFNLRPRHIDLLRQCITVEASFSKNGYERVAAIPNVMVAELASLALDKQDPEMFVFSDKLEPGRVLKRSTYSGKYWKKLREDLQLPMECKHYSLRDTAVLQLARDGVSRVDSQNHYDHHSAAMHDIYSRAAQDTGNDEVRQKMSAF